MTLNINGGKVLAFARRGDPDTSREAARETNKRLRDLHKQVLQFAFERGTGFTDDQLTAFFGTHSSTHRSRRAELTARGYIKDTGERVGDTGRRHIVWALTPEGRRAHLFGDDGLPPPMAAWRSSGGGRWTRTTTTTRLTACWPSLAWSCRMRTMRRTMIVCSIGDGIDDTQTRNAIDEARGVRAAGRLQPVLGGGLGVSL